MSDQGPISIETDVVENWSKSHDQNAAVVGECVDWDTSGYAAHFGDAFHDFTTAISQISPIRAKAIAATAHQSRTLASYGRQDIAAFTDAADSAAAQINNVVT